MSNAIAPLEKILLPFAVEAGKQPHVGAIENGLTRLMPLTLTGAIFILINNVFLSSGEGLSFYSMGIRLDVSTIETLNSLKDIGGNVYNNTLGVISLVAPFFIGTALAEERKIDSLAAGLLFAAAFMTVAPHSVSEAYVIGINRLGGANIISGVIVGLAVAKVFTLVVHRNWVIGLPDSVPVSVSRSFSVLTPGFLTLSTVGVIIQVSNTWDTDPHQIIIDSISIPLASLGNVVGWVYVTFVPLLWFFGIYGPLTLVVLDSGIMTLWMLENTSIYQQFGSADAVPKTSETSHIWARPMLDSYTFLGGSGATLGLIIAIFLASHCPGYRQVAKLALPSGLSQTNESILFDLPIIMSPVMFIPLILVQPILAVITLAACHSGVTPPITDITPWAMPTSLGAFSNASSSVATLLVTLFGLSIATLVYPPFVMVANKVQSVINREESEEDIANALRFQIQSDMVLRSCRTEPEEKSMLDIESVVDTQSETKELGEVVMDLIINSGRARSLAYGVLKMVKQGDFESIKTMMGQSRLTLSEARLVQTRLTEGDQGEGKMKVNLVPIHAQDHLITSILAHKLMTKLTELHKKLKQRGVHNIATDQRTGNRNRL